MQFKVGDIVVVDKKVGWSVPEGEDEEFTWVPEMDECVNNGSEWEVVRVEDYAIEIKNCLVEYQWWYFPPESLRLI